MQPLKKKNQRRNCDYYCETIDDSDKFEQKEINKTNKYNRRVIYSVTLKNHVSKRRLHILITRKSSLTQ